ncbi:MAG: phosphoenolpyruvate carboxylase, partial [Myxococcales bacterium]|nr:phosphoenolpyruvate carboxylase [Myxococcales bacterium]
MEENTQTTDRALQDDVHRLGDMLGEVIRAHGGEALFQQVETMRRAAKTARESSDETTREGARETLTKAAAGLSPRQALDVARAFTLYFRLVNVAEDVHRTRLLRHWEMEGAKAHGPERGTAAVPESLLHTVDDMVAAGANRESIEATLQDLHIRCVFTAHPTEARRRTTERLLRDVRVSLEEKDRRAHTATEEFARERRLRATVESLWEHASERGQRPEVLEEVKAGLWYIEMVLFDAVPKVQRRLAKALEVNFGP